MENSQELFFQKEEYMNVMLERLSNWDKSTDQSIQVLEENMQTIEAMQEIDRDLTIEQLNEYNKLHAGTWQEIIVKQKEVVESVLVQKDKVEDQLVQMGQKDKVVSSYISLQKDSAFVKKDY